MALCWFAAPRSQNNQARNCEKSSSKRQNSGEGGRRRHGGRTKTLRDPAQNTGGHQDGVLSCRTRGAYPWTTLPIDPFSPLPGRRQRDVPQRELGPGTASGRITKIKKTKKKKKKKNKKKKKKKKKTEGSANQSGWWNNVSLKTHELAKYGGRPKSAVQ